ncbi:MAG TPA: hypothetical protein VGM86_27390 [Thermoanaerobaculia bacterium]|jgi:hypothetical protein
MPQTGSGDQTFLIVPSVGTNVCITAGTSSGDTVTLQTIQNPPSSTQLWSASFQTNEENGVTVAGFAFINSASTTPMSITSQGTNQPLVMQSFSFDSGDQDAWYIVGSGTLPAVQFVWPGDNTSNWNDFGGQGNPGDTVGLWTGVGSNSIWQLVVPSPSTPNP